MSYDLSKVTLVPTPWSIEYYMESLIQKASLQADQDCAILETVFQRPVPLNTWMELYNNYFGILVPEHSEEAV